MEQWEADLENFMEEAKIQIVSPTQQPSPPPYYPTPPNSPDLPQLPSPPATALHIPDLQTSTPLLPNQYTHRPGYRRFYPDICNPAWYTRFQYDPHTQYQGIYRHVFSGGVIESILNILDETQSIIEYLPGETAVHFLALLRDYITIGEQAIYSAYRYPSSLPPLTTPNELLNIICIGDLNAEYLTPPWNYIPAISQRELEDRERWEHIMELDGPEEFSTGH